MRLRTPVSEPLDRLAGAGVGTMVCVTDVDSSGSERLRLAEFGLRPGAVLTVLARTAGGGHLVGLGTSRIVLDHRTAGRLSVRPA